MTNEYRQVLAVFSEDHMLADMTKMIEALDELGDHSVAGITRGELDLDLVVSGCDLVVYRSEDNALWVVGNEAGDCAPPEASRDDAIRIAITELGLEDLDDYHTSSYRTSSWNFWLISAWLARKLRDRPESAETHVTAAHGKFFWRLPAGRVITEVRVLDAIYREQHPHEFGPCEDGESAPYVGKQEEDNDQV